MVFLSRTALFLSCMMPNFSAIARLLVYSVMLVPTSAQAQIFIEHISPPVVERGKTTRVTVVGRDLEHAENLWNSLPNGAITVKPVESNPARAIFDVAVAKDAPVGVLGVRVATRNGLSNAHLLLIDDLPVRPKTDVPKVSLPAAIWSTFREAEIDRYSIEVNAGQRVSFEVVGSRFGKDADPLLTIRDTKRKWIAERDNDPGLYYDCRFEHLFTEAGTYLVEVRDSRFRGSEHHPYLLRMGRFLAGRVALPSVVKLGRNELGLPEMSGAPIPFELMRGKQAGPFFATIRRQDDEGSIWLPLTTTEGEIAVARPFDHSRASLQAQTITPATTLAFNLSPLRVNPFLSIDALLLTGRGQATPVKVPGVLCGALRKPGERNAFQFSLEKGQSIYVRGEARALNSPAELELAITDRFGRELRRGSEKNDEVTLDFTAGTPGTFGLIVRDALRDGGDAFAYRITVSDKPFPPVIVADVEGLTVPQGSYQPIPLTITRTGTTGPIQLKLLGTPPGLKLVPDEIGEKENAIVCKLVADVGTSRGSYALQIVAETSSGSTLVRTQPLIDKQLINVDLIPHALREDQKRLPPSVADRLAVLITPPAPFTMEIPEATITLARYQQAGIPIVTSRVPGFKEPITFTAKGGQLADKKEGRTRVYAEFPEATASQLEVAGSVHSKILSNLAKSRIEVTGTTIHEGRRISLIRIFELNLTTAFSITAEPTKVSLLPGESTKVRLVANRLKGFDDEVNVRLGMIAGVQMPATVIIPKGQVDIEIEIKADVDAAARKQNVQLSSSATVSGYEEEQRGSLELEIRKVEAPKKK